MCEENKKICLFYASDEHLVNILLPYINNLKNELENIETIFENNLEKIFNKMVKINYKYKKLNILNWKNIKNEKKDKKIKIIIIAGKEEFVEKNNNNNLINKDEMCIINCYCILNNKINFKSILESHDYVLTTRWWNRKDKKI